MLPGQSSPLNENPTLPFAWAMWPTGLPLFVGSRLQAFLPAKLPWSPAFPCRGFRKRCQEAGRHGAYEMVAPWAGTLDQELPRTLKILNPRYGSPKHFFFGQPLSCGSKVEFFRTHWSPQDLDPCGVHTSSPNSSMPYGTSPALFLVRVLPVFT